LATTSPARAPAGSPSEPRSAFRRRKAARRARVPAIYNQANEDAGVVEFLTIEKGLGPDGRVAVVRFDRGDGINALSPEALRQLTRAARTFEDDSETSVVVLTGGAHAFSAGFDLRDPEGLSRRTMDLGS